MEYDELYDESPYTSKEVPRRGGIMTTIRATFLICATILASVFAMLFYGYQQDQIVVSSNGAFVSIFDRKSRTINICDKGSCNLLRPHFESPPPFMSQIMPQMGKSGHPMMGPHMGGGHPHMMGHPPMGNPQMMGSPPMGNPQMMGGQMGNQPMMPPPMMGNPQMISGPPPGGMQPQMMGGGAPAANQGPADEAAEDEEKPAADEPEEDAAPV